MGWLTLRGDRIALGLTDLTPWWCLSCGPAGTADQFQNLLLLVPLGVGAALMGWRARTTFASLLALSIAIELLQGVLGNGRDAALGDVVANSVGGLLGWWFVQLGSRRWPRMQQMAAPIGVGLFVAQLIATASLAGPAVHGPEPWQLRLRPAPADRPAYRGAMLSIALGGRRILTESPKPAQPPDASAPDLAAHYEWDPPERSELIAIARLDDARHWAIASIDLRQQQLGIALRTLGGTLRLRTPIWMIDVPAHLSSGDTLLHALSLGNGRAVVTLQHGGAVDSAAFRYGAQHGWALINPFTRVHTDPAAWNRWTLAWLFGWGVLLGLFSMQARRPAAWLGAALAALLIITATAGAFAGPLEWVALIAGWGATSLATGRTLRRSPDAA